jgi:hypothetical protein
MTANITLARQGQAVGKNRKEKGFTRAMLLQTIIQNRGGSMSIEPTIEARFYQPGQSTCYCCVWIHHAGQYFTGGGRASGHGFHHPSTALENALNDAGITLSQSIDGAGEGAMSDALAAVGGALGLDNMHILCVHP